MVNIEMGSFRRSASVVHRDGASQNGEASPNTSPSPKSSHLRGSSLDLHMVLERVRAAFPCVFLQRSSRPSERTKFKGLPHRRRAFFHFSVCFMIGVLIGFTRFTAVDVSKDFASKHETFSFEEDLAAGNAQWKIDSVRKEALVLDKQPFKDNKEEALVLDKQPFEDNLSLGTVARWDMHDEVLDASYAQSPFQDSELVPQKLLIIVTPTYARPFQAYYMNRLAHTLRVVPPPLLWIVVEIAVQSAETANILRETGVMYRHLVCDQNATTVKDRSIHQRNVALSHIEKHHLDGTVFFADDDKVYLADLFDQMRLIRRFGTWPVAMLAESKNKVLMEGPVCNGTQVIGWHTNQRSKLSRRFHVDMSGFAFNSTILWDPKRWSRPTPEPIRQRNTVQDGFQETTFVEQLVEDESQMEGLPNDCSRIMVWHLHLEAPELVYPNGWLMQKNLEVVAPLT